MELLIEIIKFVIYSVLIVVISKYILVKLLRNLGENLNLKSNTIGNVAGIATSVPEFLTISFAAYGGLIETSIFNVLSSNVINVVQYIASIVLNKNMNILKNKALKIDLILVGITIIIPILLVILEIEISLKIIPIFILLFIVSYYINNNAHKLYLKVSSKKIEEEIKKEAKWVKGKRKLTIKYMVQLLAVGIVLFIIRKFINNQFRKFM